MAAIVVGGSGSEALLAGAVARGHAPPGSARGAAAGRAERSVAADVVMADCALPGTRVLADLPGVCLHWSLRAEPETTYWETGGPPVSPVLVTASGLVDGSAWRERGGLAGLGPDGFAQDGMSDGMYPGPLLEVLAERAVTGSPRFASESAPIASAARPPASPAGSTDGAVPAMTDAGLVAGIPGVPGADGVRRLGDDELLGVASATRRLRNRAEWLELAALAEFTRRRYAETEAAAAGGARPGRRAGEFAGEEVAFQLVCSGRAADERMELAVALAARLPRVFARMADGAVGSYQALIVHRATCELSAEDVAAADAILAAEAPFLTPEALRGRAWRVAMTLDPEAAARRKKRGARRKRVEMWAEDSGNAALAGREMDPADALAATAYYDALARALRRGGVPGSLRELRHLAYTDRNTGRDPLDRLAADGHVTVSGARGPDHGKPDDERPAGRDGAWDDGPCDHGLRDYGPCDDGYRDDEPGDDDGDAEEGGNRDDDGDGGGAGDPAPEGDAVSDAVPVPANITILVPVGTLLGWSGAPGEASRLGSLDPWTTRDLVRAASRHPRTRWCVTVVSDTDGTAVGHGCAPGRRPWTPAGTSGPGNGGDVRAGPASPRAERVARLLDWLGIVPEPVARGSCDHRHRADRYTPSRNLAHLIRARTATCSAPGCGARAEHCDLDHTVRWPAGPTDECNLAPLCRRHHRVKQAPGWELRQPEPGVMRWITPSGRVHTARPTSYVRE